MFRGTSDTYARFSSREFEEEQDATRTLRLRVCKAIGLSPDFVDHFYVITKKDAQVKGDYYGARDLLPVAGLSMLYPIELPGVPVPEEVVAKTRGVVMYNFDFRYTLPVRTPDEPLMDKLIIKGPKLAIPGETREIGLLLSTVRIRNYKYGLRLNYLKANGKPMFVTQHNTLIGGAWHNGDRLHKAAKRGDRDAPSFMSLINLAAENSDPTLLTGAGWFPDACNFSNKCYTFILCAKDVSHNEFDFDGVPCLVLVDCAKQWSNKFPPPGVNIGTPHHGYYSSSDRSLNKLVAMETPDGKPYYLPKYTRPIDRSLPYVENTVFLNPQEADAVLHGSITNSDVRFRGGGKVIVTGRTSESGHLHVYHACSSGDKHRRSVLGDNASMYHNLLDCLDKEDYDMQDPAQLNAYLKVLPALVPPGDDSQDLMSVRVLQEVVDNREEIMIIVLPPLIAQKIVSMKNIRNVWFNFLAAANKEDRPEVFRMFIRYLWEFKRAKQYLVYEAKDLRTLAPNVPGMSKEDIEERNYAIRKLQKARQIGIGKALGLTNEAGKPDLAAQSDALHVYMSNHRRFVRKVVKLVLFMTGEKAIAVSKQRFERPPPAFQMPSASAVPSQTASVSPRKTVVGMGAVRR